MFILHGGSQLHEFLKSLAIIALAHPAKALAAGAARQQELTQQLQQTRDAALAAAAAAAAAGGDVQQMRTHLRVLKQLQQQQHWLLLYVQLLIANHQGPEALANHRLAPPKQLLQDEAAQAEVSCFYRILQIILIACMYTSVFLRGYIYIYLYLYICISRSLCIHILPR